MQFSSQFSLLGSVGAAFAFGFALLAPLPGAAYSEPALFHIGVEGGGSSGRFFTGSPVEGYGCNVCHAGGEPYRAQITGLPKSGYVPGRSYVLEVSWPEFSALEDAAAQANSGIPATRAGLTLEISSEDNVAGTVELRTRVLSEESEICSTGINRTRASEMFSLRPGKEVESDLVRCVTASPGDRCVVAVRPCGARTAIVRWTAPSSFVGPLWLSAGLTTTTSASNSADGDGTYQLLIAIPEAGSASSSYEEAVSAHCGVTAAGVQRDRRLGMYLLLPVGLSIARRRGPWSKKGARR